MDVVKCTQPGDYEYRPSLNCNNVYYQTCTGNSNLSIYNYIYCRNCVMVFVCDQYYYYYESSVLTQLLMLNLHNVKIYYGSLVWYNSWFNK